MINPDNRYKESWDIFIIVLVLLAAIEIPLRIALGYPLGRLLLIADIIISFFLLVDIVLQFFTSAHINGQVVTDKSRVRRNYLKTWFSFDVLGTIPFDLIISIVLPGSHSLGFFLALRWVRLTRLVRLARMAQLMTKWQKRHVINPSVLRLVFFMFWICLIAHWAACGWLLLGSVSQYQHTPTAYLRALYWTVTTLTTVGYGDIVPQTNGQTIYTMVIMILGVGVYGYVIGNVSSLLANMDISKANYRKKMEEINAFLKYKEIPPTLQDRVRSYYDHLWENQRGYDESTLLKDLPFSLKTDIALCLCKDILEKVPLFQGASQQLIRELAKKLKAIYATPGDYIIRKGEPGDSMYFISRGQVEVVSDSGEMALATLTDGHFFGEMSLLEEGLKRTANIRSVGYADLYILDKKTFDGVLNRHPGLKSKLQEIAKSRSQQINKDN